MEENQKHLLADMIEEYIESRKYTFREIESYCWYKRVSRIPVAYFREREIYFEDLTTKVVMAFFSEARYKDDGTFYSQKYLYAWRGILKAVINYMEDEKNVLIKNPFGRQFKMPWVPKYNPRERNIPDDALVKVLEVLRGNYRYQVVSVLLLHTGMRIGELCGLRRGDVDFQAKVIRIKHHH